MPSRGLRLLCQLCCYALQEYLKPFIQLKISKHFHNTLWIHLEYKYQWPFQNQMKKTSQRNGPFLATKTLAVVHGVGSLSLLILLSILLSSTLFQLDVVNSNGEGLFSSQWSFCPEAISFQPQPLSEMIHHYPRKVKRPIAIPWLSYPNITVIVNSWWVGICPV